MNFDGLLEVLGVDKAALGGSLLGAMLSLRFMDPATSTGGRIFLAAGGFCAAAFGTPFAVGVIEIKSHYAISGLSFFFGLYGMSLIDVFYQQIKSGALLAAVKAKFGLGGPGQGGS